MDPAQRAVALRTTLAKESKCSLTVRHFPPARLREAFRLIAALGRAKGSVAFAFRTRFSQNFGGVAGLEAHAGGARRAVLAPLRALRKGPGRLRAARGPFERLPARRARVLSLREAAGRPRSHGEPGVLGGLRRARADPGDGRRGGPAGGRGEARAPHPGLHRTAGAGGTPSSCGGASAARRRCSSRCGGAGSCRTTPGARGRRRARGSLFRGGAPRGAGGRGRKPSWARPGPRRARPGGAWWFSAF